MPSRDLYQNLPLYPRWLDTKGILQHICNAIQPELDKVFDLVQSQETLYNPELCPDNLLDWLGQIVGAAPIENRWLGLGMNPEWHPGYKRYFLSQIWTYWQVKGTEMGVRQAIALWLQYRAWEKTALKINLPFGRIPTNSPPAWWGYDTPYDYHASQTYSERKFLGSGEYPQQWNPIWEFLDAEYSWGYDIVWNYQLKYHEKRSRINSSYLGINSPWMHFYPQEVEWNKVFPNIDALNIEIWNVNARPTVFGWKRVLQRCIKKLERSEIAVDKKTVVEYAFDGFQYGDRSPGSDFYSPGTLWYLPVSQNTKKEIISEQVTEFGYFPEDEYNGYCNLWVDQWYVPLSKIIERTVAFIDVPGNFCTSGVETSIKLGGKKDVVVPGQSPKNANALLQKTETTYSLAFSKNTNLIPNIRPYTQDLGEFSLETADLTVGAIDIDDLGYLMVEDYLESGYIWEEEIIVALYDTLFDSGYLWYTPQIFGTPDRTVQVDNEDVTEVSLCNIFALWSTFTTMYWREYTVNLEEKEYSLYDLYPELEEVLNAGSWKLQVITIDGIYTTKPFVAFFQDEKGNPYFHFAKGDNELHLEFVLQVERKTAIQSISLALQHKLIYYETYVTPQAWSDKTILGVEINVTLT